MTTRIHAPGAMTSRGTPLQAALHAWLMTPGGFIGGYQRRRATRLRRIHWKKCCGVPAQKPKAEFEKLRTKAESALKDTRSRLGDGGERLAEQTRVVASKAVELEEKKSNIIQMLMMAGITLLFAAFGLMSLLVLVVLPSIRNTA